MAIIDNRLKDCDTDQDITENFNRVLNIVDNKSTIDYTIKFVDFEVGETTILNCTPNDVLGWLEESDNKLLIIAYSYSEGTLTQVPINLITKVGDDYSLQASAYNVGFFSSDEDEKYVMSIMQG